MTCRVPLRCRNRIGGETISSRRVVARRRFRPQKVRKQIFISRLSLCTQLSCTAYALSTRYFNRLAGATEHIVVVVEIVSTAQFSFPRRQIYASQNNIPRDGNRDENARFSDFGAKHRFVLVGTQLYVTFTEQ